MQVVPQRCKGVRCGEGPRSAAERSNFGANPPQPGCPAASVGTHAVVRGEHRDLELGVLEGGHQAHVVDDLPELGEAVLVQGVRKRGVRLGTRDAWGVGWVWEGSAGVSQRGAWHGGARCQRCKREGRTPSARPWRQTCRGRNLPSMQMQRRANAQLDAGRAMFLFRVRVGRDWRWLRASARCGSLVIPGLAGPRVI